MSSVHDKEEKDIKSGVNSNGRKQLEAAIRPLSEPLKSNQTDEAGKEESHTLFEESVESARKVIKGKSLDPLVKMVDPLPLNPIITPKDKPNDKNIIEIKHKETNEIRPKVNNSKGATNPDDASLIKEGDGSSLVKEGNSSKGDQSKVEKEGDGNGAGGDIMTYQQSLDNLKASFESLSSDRTSQAARDALLEAASKVDFKNHICPNYAFTFVRDGDTSQIDHALDLYNIGMLRPLLSDKRSELEKFLKENSAVVRKYHPNLIKHSNPEKALLDEFFKRNFQVLKRYNPKTTKFEKNEVQLFLFEFLRDEESDLRKALYKGLGLDPDSGTLIGPDQELVRKTVVQLKSYYMSYVSKNESNIMQLYRADLQKALLEVSRHLSKAVIADLSKVAHWESILIIANEQIPVKIYGTFDVLNDTQAFYREACEHVIRDVVSQAGEYTSLTPIVDAYKQRMNGNPIQILTDAEIVERMIEAIACLGVPQISQLLTTNSKLYTRAKRRATLHLENAIANLDTFRVTEYVQILDNLVAAYGYKRDRTTLENGPIPEEVSDPANAASKWISTRKKFCQEKLFLASDEYRKTIRANDVDHNVEAKFYNFAELLDLPAFSPAFLYVKLINNEVQDWCHSLSSKEIDEQDLTQTQSFIDLEVFYGKLFPNARSLTGSFPEKIAGFCDVLTRRNPDNFVSYDSIAANLRKHASA